MKSAGMPLAWRKPSTCVLTGTLLRYSTADINNHVHVRRITVSSGFVAIGSVTALTQVSPPSSLDPCDGDTMLYLFTYPEMYPVLAGDEQYVGGSSCGSSWARIDDTMTTITPGDYLLAITPFHWKPYDATAAALFGTYTFYDFGYPSYALPASGKETTPVASWFRVTGTNQVIDYEIQLTNATCSASGLPVTP